MRYPTLNDGTIDEDESVRLIRYGIDHGINYIDTLYIITMSKSDGLVAKAP